MYEYTGRVLRGAGCAGFDACLRHCYGLHADFLECRSTNCGNNITYLLELLRENSVSFRSIILAQDGTMQRRMSAGLPISSSSPASGIYGSPARTARIVKTCDPFSATLSGRRKLQ